MYYIVVTSSEGEGEEYHSPVGAANPAQAVSKQGVDIDNHEEVHVYPIQTTPTGGYEVVKVKDS